MTSPRENGARPQNRLTAGTLRSYKKGELIYCQGKQADSVCILQSGRIKIERYTDDGKSVPLKIVRPGQMFGELALLNRVSFDNAICELNSCVVTYPITLLQQEIDSQSETMKLLTHSMLGTIRSMTQGLELRTIRSAEERVMKYLSWVKQTGSKYIQLERSYKDIAEHMGLTPEAVYRTLASLEKQGIISRYENTIAINQRSIDEWQSMKSEDNIFDIAS